MGPELSFIREDSWNAIAIAPYESALKGVKKLREEARNVSKSLDAKDILNQLSSQLEEIEKAEKGKRQTTALDIYTENRIHLIGMTRIQNLCQFARKLPETMKSRWELHKNNFEKVAKFIHSLNGINLVTIENGMLKNASGSDSKPYTLSSEKLTNSLAIIAGYKPLQEGINVSKSAKSLIGRVPAIIHNLTEETEEICKIAAKFDEQKDTISKCVSTFNKILWYAKGSPLTYLYARDMSSVNIEFPRLKETEKVAS